ncbi:MAG: PQQ-like beta-propeller repeat protein [Candidatus Eremiobacteraeota bacterium]|nr:PQQ-like beta-propeller repeat protein [Candidatus Eremiobacteraeota bacterium]MBV9055222.1 PQQ-like beta-propeller repeat protein [Candidatus Eremiobacteraeota bacterium]
MKKYRYLVALVLGGALAGCSGGMQPALPSAQNGITPLAHNSSPVTAALPPMLRAALSGSASWPQSYYGPGHTGYNPNETTLSPSNVSGLTLLGGPNTGCTPLAVVLYQGTLFTVHNGCGSIPGTLAAFDAATFVQKWSATVGSWPVDPESIAVGDGRVMTGCAYPNSSPGLCAYSRGSGKLLWAYNPCPSSCGGAGGLDSNFAYANGVIYVSFHTGGGGSQAIYAISAKTGTVLWSGLPQGYYIYSGFVVGTNYVYYACGRFHYGVGLCALNRADGSLAWSSFPNIGMESMALAYSNGTVYVNSQGPGSTPQVGAFNGTTGALLWANASYGGSWQSPAVAKGVVYFPVYPGSGPLLIALSGTTGKLRWSVSETDQSGPSVANGVVYTVTTLDSSHFQTVAHGASDGKALWSAAANRSGNLPPPIIANGTLYSPDAGPTCGLCAYGLTSKAHKRLGGRQL